MASNNGGTKKRRSLRSMASNEKKRRKMATSPCNGKENVTVPLFLKKTYEMICTCDPSIACWTEDGDMFVVKAQETFEREIIPQYFNHNKFSSFARQLNFYGFRKMQIKPLRKDEFHKETSKHVTFYNEKFQRGRQDLLSQIQRSTKGKNTSSQEQQTKINELKERVDFLEDQVQHLMNFLDPNNSRNHDQKNCPTNMPSVDSGQQTNPTRASYQKSIVSGERANETPSYSPAPGTTSNVPHSEASIVSIIQVTPEVKPRQPTLKPHPNAKNLPDDFILPSPHLTDSTTFMRGLSKVYDGDFLNILPPDETVQKTHQADITQPPANGNTDKMQQPDLNIVQLEDLQWATSEGGQR